MKKIPTLFKRDPTTHLVTPEPNVILPDGAVPTVKWDGSAVMFDGDQWWKRREVKPNKPIPEGYVEVDHDPVTGKRQGWMPITAGPEDKWFRDAIRGYLLDFVLSPGTYEAVGPHFQGDPHLLHFDTLKRHGVDTLIGWGDLGGFVSHYDHIALRALLEVNANIEGAVWWADGQPIAKLKRRDFGFVWPLEKA